MPLKLQPNPTFWADVQLVLPGATEVTTFKGEFVHKTRAQLTAYQESKDDMNDAANVMKLMKNWSGIDGDPPFTIENVSELLQNYHGAGRAIATTYIRELMQVRLGN